jgi:hypothetical protein
VEVNEQKNKQGENSLRSPEGTTGLRHKGMSKARVSCFFNALHDTLQKTGIKDSSVIWNMDESGFQLAHRPGKIIARYM